MSGLKRFSKSKTFLVPLTHRQRAPSLSSSFRSFLILNQPKLPLLVQVFRSFQKFSRLLCRIERFDREASVVFVSGFLDFSMGFAIELIVRLIRTLVLLDKRLLLNWLSSATFECCIGDYF